MKNLARIFKWLSTFEEKERKQFLALVRTLKGVRSQRTKKLVEYLWECSENSNEPKIEIVSMMFYKKTTFDKGQMRNYLKKTWDLVEDFLVNKYMQNEFRRKQALQELAINRRIYDEFKDINDELISNNSLHIGSEGHFYKYQWQLKKYYWDGNKFGNVKQRRVEFKELSDTLEQVYAISKLQLLCEQASRISVSNDVSNILLDDALQAIIQRFQEKNPIIKLYYLVYLLLSKQLSIKISELEQFFYDYYLFVTIDEQLQLIIHITNHVITNFNKYNDEDSRKALLELYKLRLVLNEKNTNNNQLFSPYIFINTTQIAVVQLELEFAKKFIATYSENLPSETKHVVTSLCKAIISHKQENFQKAASLLKDLKITDKEISVRLFTYRILCLVDYNFFIDKDREIVREACYLFKKWLIRNQSIFGKTSHLLYTNLVYFILQLIALDTDLDELEAKIKETPYIGSKNWLLRKVNQLNKK